MAANPSAIPLVERRVVAVFDLDGTLTRRDTLFPFLAFVLGVPRFLMRLPLALPWLAGMALRLVSRDRAKEAVLRVFLGGMAREVLEARGEQFARERLPRLMRPQALARFAWHKDRRHRCALATASLDLYVAPWAKAAGFDDLFCTSLHYAQGRATGALAGGNCRAEEKARRLRERYGEPSGLVLHGYGDSADDRPFLALCAESHYRPFRGPDDAGPGVAPKAQNRIGDFVRLMRPHQWVKNGFVFVGVLFGHAWDEPPMLVAAVFAAAGFSLVSSAIYIVNDLADRSRDRLHPKKRLRPLASGSVSVPAAIAVAAALGLAGGALAFHAAPAVLGIVAAYAVMNIAYSFALKNVVILDVFVIATGFLLRILAGTAGLGIAPSKWLLVCSLFLTLFLGFTKRRSELLVVSAEFITHRKALLHYNPALLDKMIGISACAALLSYSLYTMSAETVALQGTENLIYTIPLVAYGMFRYLYLLHAKHAGTDTSGDLFRDLHLAATVVLWGGITAWLIA